jgi:signal transduction histidine kinase
MPNGGILSLSTQRKENQVELTISDNGSGIHVEHQVRVFDPFYSTKDKGTGLGLPYVRQIVEEYDGRVELRSEPQNGTTILIRLPIMRSINTQEA